MQYISLCAVDNHLEANLIEEDLAEAGIKCIVTNENFTTMMPHLTHLPGCGIQILVHNLDLEIASDIVAKRSKRQIESCPICESRNISYGVGTKHRGKRLTGLFLSIFTAVLAPHIRPVYYCLDCKAEFGR